MWQPRGSGPATTPVAGTTLLYFATVEQVSTKARPVVVPTEAVNPARKRAFSDKSTPSPTLLKATAHSFGPEDLELWIRVLHTMVTLRGTVTIVHRAETLGKILIGMESRFGDIRVAPLYAREGAAASRIIVQGVKGSKGPMQLLPGLVLHGPNAQFTPEAESILRDGLAWRLR